MFELQLEQIGRCKLAIKSIQTVILRYIFTHELIRINNMLHAVHRLARCHLLSALSHSRCIYAALKCH